MTPERAVTYSPLSFLRGHEAALAAHFDWALEDDLMAGRAREFGSRARWHVREMRWDSAYFDTPMFVIAAAVWDDSVGQPLQALSQAAAALQDELATRYDRYYVWADLPAEEHIPLQALGMQGFRLVESRLTYYLPDALAHAWPERFPVRRAGLDDIAHLRDVAASARNPGDRYHADPFFGPAVADRYLATYVEESVKGLAELVLVPDPGDPEPPGGFFTATLTVPPVCPLGGPQPCDMQVAVGRMPLVAISPERSGWHLRLLAETTRALAERSADVVCMTTQATNKAVIRNCEKLGFRLGRVTHVLAASRGHAR